MKRVEFNQTLVQFRHGVGLDMQQRSVRGQLPNPDHERRLLTLGLLLSRQTMYSPVEMRDIVNSLQTDHV